MNARTVRLGVDLGGTKIEILALGDEGQTLLRERVPTPRGDYDATVGAIAGLVQDAENMLGRRGSVGVAIPGTLSPATGLVKNANSTWLNGRPFDRDLASALGRHVRLANDANCFALSEASDGAAKGADTVFGVILGTGVGGGVCLDGRVLIGAHAIAGEWGHNPLPFPRDDERPGAPCYCGQRGCIETWCSGPALAREFEHASGRATTADAIAAAAASGDRHARAVIEAWLDRLARALAGIVNILDPDVIVLGGGLSNIEALYAGLPGRVAGYAFAPEGPSRIVKNAHGDSSGVRGAAWLWPLADMTHGLPT